MGMYNEVWKKCPHCDSGRGYMQISQVVLGFGGFYLDDPRTLEDLSLEELKRLREQVYDDYFVCGNKDCGRSFRMLSDQDAEARRQLIKELTE